MSFDELRVVECHSSLNHLQCAPRYGSVEIWSSEDKKVDVDPETFRARRPLPSCPACGGLARPNVLMFGDFAPGLVEFTDNGGPLRVDLNAVSLPDDMAERGRGLPLAKAVLDRLIYQRDVMNHWTLVSKHFEPGI